MSLVGKLRTVGEVIFSTEHAQIPPVVAVSLCKRDCAKIRIEELAPFQLISVNLCHTPQEVELE